MNILSSLSYKLRHRLNRLSALLARKWKSSFYLYLAGFFSVLIVVDAAFLHLTTEMKQVGFDMMVRYRFVVPEPDPDIVIIDIDESSLAAMAKEYGRWPWPRQVMGKLVEQIEKQHPRALVFDIIFSEPDVYNPGSDAVFDAVIASTDNTYFPMLRLNSLDDPQSKLTPAMIPGAIPLEGEAQAGATIAMLMPYFKSVQEGNRLGLNNINPDSDGVVRQQLAYIDDYGWKIPSLPLRLAQGLDFPETDAQRVMLNWRGPPDTYHKVSFSDVFFDKAAENRRPADEFTGKIVILGSTASSLFDIKPTPMSRLHPGVEILATAIDNFKHKDYLRFPEGRITYMLITLFVIWATAWGFYRDTGRDKLDFLFGASQFILIGISYGSINLTNTYINLTGPVTLGLAYFTVARLYSYATGHMLEISAVRTSLQRSGDQLGVLMLINLGGHSGALNAGVRESIRQGLVKIGSPEMSVEILKHTQKGVWNLFENIVAVSWTIQAGAEDGESRVRRDIDAIGRALLPLLRKHYLVTEQEVGWIVQEGTIAGGAQARESWRTLFGTALSRWNEANKPG